MALTTAVHDSLPYIDPEPTASESAAAQALIDADLPSESTTNPIEHPSLPLLPPIAFTPIIQEELTRVSSTSPPTPLSSIDLSRYESTTSSSSSSTPTPSLLAQAYTTSTYLRLREDSMSLLSQFGKNAWLIANSQTEDVLRGLERDLERTKAEIDALVVERRGAQEGVRGEVEGLREGWRRGVGRVLETEVAAEAVRREILERRRGAAGAAGAGMER